MKNPEYLFESSWEVCNKVGGIYTVLSTKAYTLKQTFGDRLIFIGPDLWKDKNAPDFKTDNRLFPKWRKDAEKNGLKVKVGRWMVPGEPPVILVDFRPFMTERDQLFYSMWEDFQVDSMHAYGDYDESCIFAYAVGRVIESFYHCYHLDKKSVVALFNEWMLGMGALYVQKHLPAVATLFTTHATSIGRSIAGNNKALYAYMDGYNGDQMARELNMEAKHSIEKQTAHHVDCFTVVSDITARECKQLLDKAPDVVTPNGFEPNFVPAAKEYTEKRAKARGILIKLAEKLTGCKIASDAFLISTSGRYEYRNKGIDVFIEAMNRVRTSGQLQRDVIAFVTVPAWVREPRADLKVMMDQDLESNVSMQMPFSTHWLNQMENDKVLNYIQHAGFTNNEESKLKIVFVPCYLDGNDGIINLPYYDVLIGMDATVFPSYYEPWGYTPLESIAFGIPTITTDLAGFGLWAKNHVSGDDICEGVTVVKRTDFNYFEVADEITKSVLTLVKLDDEQLKTVRNHSRQLSHKAEWSSFITYYYEAFRIAMEKAEERMKNYKGN